MTEQTSTPPIRQGAPPEWLFKVANPIIKLILRSPLHGLLSKQLMLITVTGRKTGKNFTFPVGYQEEGNRLTVFTFHHWYKNLGEGAPVTVRLRGKNVSGFARPTRDRAAILKFVETFRARRSPTEAQRMGISPENERMTLVHIELDGNKG